MTTDSKPFYGFYGALPSQAGAVSRGLPAAVGEALSAWLEAGFSGTPAEGREERLAGAAPWRFAASAGLFGPQTVAGVVMPSRDASGRPAPCVVLASLGEADAVEACACGRWSEAVEILARTAITQSLSPDHLVEALEELGEPGPTTGARPFEVRSIDGGVRVDVEATPTLAVNMLDAARRERAADGIISLWWRVSGLHPGLFLLDGLPDGEAFEAVFSPLERE